MASRRGLIAVAIGALVVACTGGSSEPPVLDMTPPAARRPPSSSSSSSATGGIELSTRGCPSTRIGESPVSTLTADELRRLVVGIHRSCSTQEGLEIRIDEESGEIRWYLLDTRFVRKPPPGFDGSIEIVSCEDERCTVRWTEPDPAATQPVVTGYRLRVWETPWALELLAVERGSAPAIPQEWVRVAD